LDSEVLKEGFIIFKKSWGGNQDGKFGGLSYKLLYGEL
jgi:hypothetical protein